MIADTIRTAFEALGTHDVEPLVALMHPEMEWRGRQGNDRAARPGSGHEARDVGASFRADRGLLAERPPVHAGRTESASSPAERAPYPRARAGRKATRFRELVVRYCVPLANARRC
jgi:hypothetical protein